LAFRKYSQFQDRSLGLQAANSSSELTELTWLAGIAATIFSQEMPRHHPHPRNGKTQMGHLL